MMITDTVLTTARRTLLERPRDQPRREDEIDFRVRPISREWRYVDRMPAYQSAVANAAYIWRDDTPADHLGPMPRKFAARRCELRGAGLILPASAPDWSTDAYKIWEEADAATAATGDPTAVSAWHVMMEIPASVRACRWPWMVAGFVERELAARGAVTAWAIHALEGGDGEWIVKPHAHLVVTGRYWRHDHRHGQRHPGWIGSWEAQTRLRFAWRRRCATTQLTGTVSPRWLPA